MTSPDRGIVYAAIRERYVEEAKISALSVRAVMPDARIVLFTDVPPADGSMFDEVVRLTALRARPHLDKLVAMRDSPFAETLFLDTETYVCGDISGLFELLAAFDVAMTMDRGYYDDFPPGTGVPDAFYEGNQGVVAYRRSAETTATFQAALDWAEREHARTGAPPTDQAALRVALYCSRLRIAPLPLEYNCRLHAYGYLNGVVRILHGRIPGVPHGAARLAALARRFNRHTVPRVFAGGRMQILGRRHILAREHLFAGRTVRLFWPAKAPLKAIWRGLFSRTGRLIRNRLTRRS